jgi:hypothetical protein
MPRDKSSAPGTSTRGGVNSTMSNANSVSTRAAGNGMSAPFNQPRAGGDGGSNIPTRVYDTSMGKPAVPSKTTQEGYLGAQGGQKRPGTK